MEEEEYFGDKSDNSIPQAKPVRWFQGLSFGPLDLLDTLVWYDCPIVFTARGPDAKFYVVYQTDDDRVGKTFSHILIPAIESEFADVVGLMLQGDDEDGYPRLKALCRSAVMAHGHAIHTDMNYKGFCISERTAMLDEVDAAALGTD